MPVGRGHLVHLFHLLMGGCCSSTDCTADTGPAQDGPLPLPGGSPLRAASTLIIACDRASGVTPCPGSRDAPLER